MNIEKILEWLRFRGFIECHQELTLTLKHFKQVNLKIRHLPTQLSVPSVIKYLENLQMDCRSQIRYFHCFRGMDVWEIIADHLARAQWILQLTSLRIMWPEIDEI